MPTPETEAAEAAAEATPDPFGLADMTFEDLNSRRHQILAQGKSINALPNEQLKELGMIASRLRSMSSTSKPPKRKTKGLADDEL